MKCERLEFSGHAVRQMFQRRISKEDVIAVIERAQVIAEYPDDKPFPSVLMLGFAGGRPIHLVVAKDPQSGMCIVVTAYSPNPRLWTDDFRERRRR